MALAAGSRIGSFIIQAPLGAGGMGEVYLAEDARLRRRVALKLISSDVAVDGVARKRLIREAQAAAALEHPHICTVYEVGEADGHSFIAMQYVEGHTLAHRLQTTPFDLPTALSISAQIANAVAEAHSRDVVHRDIKPQNIMLSSTNHVTVLDFGLAKVAASADSAAATASVLTEDGKVSGTLLYMSPEQARGESVDARSDVFSFGIVLYEMVARIHPFAQESWADTLAAILSREPRPITIALPSELRRIIRKCLEKDRARRYQAMRDVAIDLENLAHDIAHPAVEGVVPATAFPPPRGRAIRRTWAAIVGLVVLAAAAGILWWNREAAATVPARYEPITEFTDTATAPALSPDGRMVAFIRGGSWFLTSEGQIYVKMLPNGEAVKLTDDPRPKLGPVFSADGSRIAYTAISPGPRGASWDTWTVPVTGGTPTRLLANAAGLSWIDAKRVMFSEIQPGHAVHMGLVTATENRGEARPIYLPAHVRGMAHYSFPSPDRAWILVVEMGPMGTFERCRLVPFDGSSGGHQVGPAGACQAAAWSQDRRWMYFTAEVNGASHLWRQRFPDGAVEPLVSSPGVEEQGIAVAPDGQSLITSVGIRQSSLWLHASNGERLLSSEGYASRPTLSRDGTRLYYVLRRAATSGVDELRVMDLSTQKSDRVLPDFAVVDYALSTDEQQVAVTVRAADGALEIWLAGLDRRSAPRRLVQGGDSVAFGASNDLVFRSIESQGNFISRIGLDGQNRVHVSDIRVIELLATSPDGRWASFGADVGEKQFGVWAVPVYGGEPLRLCADGCQPQWSPDGGRLYLRLGFDPSAPIVVLPLPPGQPFPDFPKGSVDALTAWRTLAGAHVIERPTFVAGLDESSYVVVKFDERRNLFRVPLAR